MDRYQQSFNQLQDKQQGAFIPFVMLGDPDLDTSFEIIKALIAGGADALELGIPFSDPIADGPTIQKAAIRALGSGVTPGSCFTLLAKVREQFPEIPIGLLLYSNLVFARGIDEFYAQASAAGVDSILIADVPLREAAPFKAAAEKHQIKHILIAPPNASDETLQAIGEQSEGYTYLLGRAGVTGTEVAATMPATDLVDTLKAHNAAPPVIGFGISQPAQVKAAISAGAAGAIAGSATVNIIEANLDNTQSMYQKLQSFVEEMKAATL